MITAVFLLILGAVLLYVGSEAFVRGSSSLARGLRVSAAMVALTVVSFASSTPELITTLTAQLGGKADVGLGNILGSNIANIGLVLGLSAVVKPLAIRRSTVMDALPYVGGAIVVFWLLSFNGIVSRIDGLIMLAGYAVFMGHQIRGALVAKAANADAEAPPLRLGRDGVLIIIGLLGMVGGASALVSGATTIAREIGVSELFIAVSVVALGTSLPELATSTMAAWRNHPDIAVGNVLGSNILNILLVVALVAVISPLPVSAGVLSFQFPAALLFTAAAAGVVLIGTHVTRIEGAALLAFYMIYIYTSYQR